jgi:hypothetical protein
MRVCILIAGTLTGFILFSCNTSLTSPGGKLGSKNYYGNYTLGANSGTANVYVNTTGDTLVDLRYSLNSSPSVQLTQISLQEDGENYSFFKADAIGIFKGATPSNFGILTWQYITGGSTIGFTGNKVP